jgi:hypothetical protein
MHLFSQKSVAPKEKTVFERHPVVTIVAFLFVAFCIIVFGTEKYFSFKASSHSRRGIERSIRLREHRPLRLDYTVSNDDGIGPPECLAKKEWLFRTDENGFVSPSKIHDCPDLSIVFIGGSTTECRFMDEHDRFPFLAGRLIEQKTGKKCNAYNQGVSGNSTMHSNDLLLNKIIPLRADIVVLMEDINDAITLMYEGTYWNSNPSRSLIMVNNPQSMHSLFQNLKNLLIPNLYARIGGLINAGPDEFARLRGKKLIVNEHAVAEQFARSVQTFISISRIWGITPVLMTQHNRLTEQPDASFKDQMREVESVGISYEELRSVFNRFNTIIREIGKNSNVLVIDLDSLVPKESKFMYDCVHLTDSGSVFVAKKVADEISDLSMKNCNIARPLHGVSP